MPVAKSLAAMTMMSVCVALYGADGVSPAGQAAPAAPAKPDIQLAIDELQAGRPHQSERIALAVAQDDKSQVRAWLVVGEARFRRGNYAGAVEAYKTFLAGCDSADLRTYVQSRIVACQDAMIPPEPAVAPSKNLSATVLRELARVGPNEITETSDHFVVHARNVKLAKLLAAEAEKALGRICRDLLEGQEFPHLVDVYVWTDHKDYLANAPATAQEWSDGSFSLKYVAGQPVRRIDLKQRDDKGQFYAMMLDRILPHELCHLVAHEFYGQSSRPLAIDEGLAMLAEPEMDRERLAMAGAAVVGKKKIPLDRLMLMQSSDIKDASVFYAEALSFLEYLQSRLSRAEFKEFLVQVRDGASVEEAVQRALCLAPREGFLSSLAEAWEEHASTDTQYLDALGLN